MVEPMTPEALLELELTKRYQELAHALQSGIQFMITRGDSSEATPKHLRVGVNTSKSDHAALASLLIEKGIITKEEYLKSLVTFLEREVRMYEEEIFEILGRRITLA